MREILFRGKRVDNGEWVYGSYSFAPRRKGAFGQIISDLDKERHYIVSKTNYEYWEVCPETVGEYTGLTDKNGKKIFEGDIVQGEAEEARGIIEWQQTEARYLVNVRNGYEWLFMDDDEWRVIGNIHDNPELLEVKE